MSASEHGPADIPALDIPALDIPTVGYGAASVGNLLRPLTDDKAKSGRLLRSNPAFDGGLDTANDFHVPDDLHRVWDFSADGTREHRRVLRKGFVGHASS